MSEKSSIFHFADIHAHPTLRPFAYLTGGQSEKATLRYKSEYFSTIGLAKYTQADLYDLKNGNVKIVLASLYPFEQQWFKPKIEFNQNVKNLLVSAFLDFPEKRIEQILSPDFNYFEQLQLEYEFLINETEKNEYPLAIVPKTKQQLTDHLNSERIILIPSIEGAHAFISGNSANVNDLDHDSVINNLLKFKTQTPLFYVTIGHHFNNGMVQHAKSIYGKGELFYKQNAMPDKPITELGWRVIKCLLSLSQECKNTRRVAIDAKHLGIFARKELYKFIHLNSNQTIPIIYSHGAFSGLDKLDELFTLYLSGSTYKGFRTFETNVTTEDLWVLYQNKGLLGIMLDDHKLGRLTLWQWLFRRDLRWVYLLVNNFMTMVERLIKLYDAKNDVYDIFAIGSDFDGVINPLNKYPTASHLPYLMQDFIKVLSNNSKFKKYNFGYTAYEIAQKVFWHNALNFILRHFQDVDSQTPIA